MSQINKRREINRPYHPPVHIPPWTPGRKKPKTAPLQLPEPAPHEDWEAAALIGEHDEDDWTEDDTIIPEAF